MVGLHQLGQFVLEPRLRLLVARLGLSGELEGLCEQLVQHVGEIGGAAPHPLQEGFFMERLRRHLHDLGGPLAGHAHHFLPQLAARLFVQRLQLRIASGEILHKGAGEQFLLLHQGVEGEELHEQVAEVVFLELRQPLYALPGVGLLAGDETVDPCVVDNGMGREGR